MKKKLPGFLFLACILVLTPCFLSAQELDGRFSNLFDDLVTDVAIHENTLYVAGRFEYAGIKTGSWVGLRKSDAQPASANPLAIEGDVHAAIADGAGGWYIAGNFKKVQGVARRNIVHILAGNLVDSQWNPDVNEAVYALTIHGGILYLGGAFSSVNGQARNRLAAFQIGSQRLLELNPAFNGTVRTMAVDGKSIYVGGEFTKAGELSRNHLCSIDLKSYGLTDWNPNINGIVHSLAIKGDKSVLYVGGGFGLAGTTKCLNFASYDLNSGQLTSFMPRVGENNLTPVYSMAITDNTLYVGGLFRGMMVGSEWKDLPSVVSFDLTTGRFRPWLAEYKVGQIFAIAVSEGRVYLGGKPSRDRGTSVVAVDALTGKALDWNPNPSGNINSITVEGDAVFLGGSFKAVQGRWQYGLASIDIRAGKMTDWQPLYYGYKADQLLIHGNRLYALSATNGGNETVTVFDLRSGKRIDWYIWPSRFYELGNFRFIGAKDRYLYLSRHPVCLSCNYYSLIGGQSVENIVQVDTATGSATSWQPRPDPERQISKVTIKGEKMYLGGNYMTNHSSQDDCSQYPVSRFPPFLGSFDLKTGAVEDFKPAVNSCITSTHLLGDVLFIEGIFTRIFGQDRNGFAAYNVKTGKLLDWDPKPYQFSIVNETDDKLILRRFNPADKKSDIVTIDTLLGITPLPVTVQGSVAEILICEDKLVVRGNFTTAQDRRSENLAVINRQSPRQVNIIQGRIYRDNNADCQPDSARSGIGNMIVTAQPGDYYASSDADGNYRLTVDSGTYSVSQLIPVESGRTIEQRCPTSRTYAVAFKGYNQTVSGKDFANQVDLRPYLTVSVGSNRRRRCMTNRTIISFSNTGFADAENVQIHLKLPRLVSLKTADRTYTVGRDSVYVFAVGTLKANESGRILITDSVACSANIRGLTACTKVWITPSNQYRLPQNPAWDNSDIALGGKCIDNGRVQLVIKNIGQPMADSSEFRILVDAQLAFRKNYRLAAGDSLVLRVPASGKTVRVEADQRPGHPRKSQANLTVEGCAATSSDIVSKGFVDILPQDDTEPEVAIECQPIIDSFDPNDKRVSPSGTTAEHYTPTGTALRYTIRFQNTGTDTAYAVTVIDTLSEQLDIASLQMEVASHAHTFAVSGKGRPVLSWTFKNINLPDSTRDQVGSNGFVQFTIRPKVNLPEKTVIENLADIVFDYNEPVRTNTTVNVLFDPPRVIDPKNQLPESIVERVLASEPPELKGKLKVYPNPTQSRVRIQSTDASVRIEKVQVINLLGELQPVGFARTGDRVAEVSLQSSPKGMYLIRIQTNKGTWVQRVVVQ